MTRHINLLDPPQKARSPYITAFQMGVPIMLVSLVMVAWSVAVRFQVAATKQRLNAIEAQLQPVNDELSQLQTGMGIEQINANLRERVLRAEVQLKARRDIQTALKRGDLGSTQGFSEFMRAFARQTVAGLWLTGLKLENGGRDVTLKGRALTAEAVATLVAQLRREPALAGRSIANLHVAPMPVQEPAEGASAPLVAPTPQSRIYEFEISSVAIENETKTAETPISVAASMGSRGSVGSALENIAQRVSQ